MRVSLVKRIAPRVGMPATVHYVSDSSAAVVVKVNKKSIIVARVAYDESAAWRINAESDPYPCVAMPGILTEIIGEPVRYALQPNGGYSDGSVRVTLGRSVRVIDYRY